MYYAIFNNSSTEKIEIMLIREGTLRRFPAMMSFSFSSIHLCLKQTSTDLFILVMILSIFSSSGNSNGSTPQTNLISRAVLILEVIPKIGKTGLYLEIILAV